MNAPSIQQLRDDLATYLKGKPSQSWKWITHNGERILNPRIDNGIVTADGDYPEQLILEAMIAANRRLHERRSKSAQKAAVTRAKRVEKLVYQEARNLLDGKGFRPSTRCRICGKAINDGESKARGIGSDCWQRILYIVQEYGADKVFKVKEDPFEVIRAENEAGMAAAARRTAEVEAWGFKPPG